MDSLEQKLSSGLVDWDFADKLSQRNAELEYYQLLRIKLSENKLSL